ncbi:MAG: hypothetical protein Q7V05_05355 [Methanoregula sp.]|nr:hypothetical protein [Methanoregula sp.]
MNSGETTKVPHILVLKDDTPPLDLVLRALKILTGSGCLLQERSASSRGVIRLPSHRICANLHVHIHK